MRINPTNSVGYDVFGQSVDGIGDVNNDGYDDIIVGSHGNRDIASTAGAALVFAGSASGIDLSSEIRLYAPSPLGGDHFGKSVSTAGDVNGDGFLDIVIGAPQTQGPNPKTGFAVVYYGSVDGSNNIQYLTSTKIYASDGFGQEEFGHSVSGGGDINNDGYDDIIVGAFNRNGGFSKAGGAYVYYGAPSGIDVASEVLLVASDAGSLDLMGNSVAIVGDVNGDNAADVIVGAHKNNDNGSDSGSVYVSVGVDTSGTDNCPSNDDKLNPGLCGCDFGDVMVSPGHACVHHTATVDASFSPDPGARVEANAQVAANVTLGEGATIGVGRWRPSTATRP